MRTLFDPATNGRGLDESEFVPEFGDLPFLAANRLWARGCDFLNVNAANLSPYASAALASGTWAVVAAEANHPGMVAITSSGSANSGYAVYEAVASLLLAGGEFVESVVKTSADLTNLIGRFGFLNLATASAPTRGAYIDVNGTTLSGKTVNGGEAATTASTYILQAGTWYRRRVELNADATEVTFSLVTCADRVEVWTDTLATNIPTTLGVGPVLIAVDSVGSTKPVLTLDYMAHGCTRELVR